MKNYLSGSFDNDILAIIKESLSKLAMEIAIGKVFHHLKPPDQQFVYHWFFDAKTKQLERFNKGIQVEIIEDYDDDNYLCAFKDKLVIIKKDKIGHKVEH